MTALCEKAVNQQDILELEDLEPLTQSDYRKKPALNEQALTIMLYVDTQEGKEDDFMQRYHQAMPFFRGERVSLPIN